MNSILEIKILNPRRRNPIRTLVGSQKNQWVGYLYQSMAKGTTSTISGGSLEVMLVSTTNSI
jgi:hypothetical protein